MSELTDLYRDKTFEIYGKRVNGNKCVFCGAELVKGSYCNCRKSDRVNPIYKKLNAKIDYLNNFADSEESLRDQLNIAAIPQKFKGLDFDDFKITIKQQQQVLTAVKNYSDNGVANYLSGQNLLLIGNYGTGKTMLMSILCEDLIYRYRLQCRYFNAVELLYKIKNTFSSWSKISTEDILKKFRDPDVLFIDDIDKINPTDYVKELMYGIVNYRIERILPTIISANSSIEQLDSNFFGEAVVSRLAEIGHSKEIIFDFKNMRINK